MIHELTGEMRTLKQISSHINKSKSLYVLAVNHAIYGGLSTHLKSRLCFDFVGDNDALQQLCTSPSPTILCCLREKRLEFMER